MTDSERTDALRARWEADLAADRIPAEWTERVPESSFPLDEHRGQDIRNFVEPIEHYIRYHEDYLLYLEVLEVHLRRLSKTLPQDEYPAAWRRFTDGEMYNRSVLANWGMIARGADSVPYCLGLLKHSDPEVRAYGAGVLGAVGKQDGVIDALMAAAEEALEVVDPEKETLELIDTILSALGSLKNRRAIPLLARVIRDEEVNLDTRWNAAESLGALVRRRFASPDPIASALNWLQRHSAH